MEAFYRALHDEEGSRLTFPITYPQSALLGTVDVVDCLEASPTPFNTYVHACKQARAHGSVFMLIADVTDAIKIRVCSWQSGVRLKS